MSNAKKYDLGDRVRYVGKGTGGKAGTAKVNNGDVGIYLLEGDFSMSWVSFPGIDYDVAIPNADLVEVED